MKKNVYTIVALIVVLSSIGLAQEGGGRLNGTWDAEIKITNCETGARITSFQSTANFHKGGTFTGITSGMPPASRTPEVGVWRHETGNSYKFRFKAYLFNAAGVPVAYQIISHTLQLADDATTYESSGSSRIFGMDGVQTGSACSSGIGTRMVLD